MNWNENLDIGVHEMNNEHKILLDCMNKLFDEYSAKVSFEDQLRTLERLKAATVDHFDHEEKYMEKIGWEQLPTHKHIHKTLLETFGRHYARFLETKTLNDEFFHFLKFWLSAHIQGIDKKYGDFVKATKKAG